jgi:stage II sporulation protein D
MSGPRGLRIRHLAALLALVALATSCAALQPLGRPPTSGGPPSSGATPVVPGGAARTSEPLRLDREPAIDVGLAWDLDALTLEPAPAATLAREGGNDGSSASAGSGPISVRGGPGGLRADWRGGRGRWVLAPGETLIVRGSRPVAPDDPFRIRWNGKTWRGEFRVFANPRGTLTLAVRLPLETYLLGVVPGEIGALADDLLEAGRAQAIAARSYTLFYRGRRAAEGFDLYGTVEDQLYGPTESERPLATSCVETTRGRLALSGGQPIRANYCSTCGGITAEVWEAWPAASMAYLVSHPDRGSGDYCAASPQYRWREVWTAPLFAATLARFAPAQGVALPAGGVGDLVDVRVDGRSRSGRVWRLTVVTTSGEITIPAYSIRQVLRRPNGSGNASGTSILRSNLFKVDVRRDPATRRALAVVVSGAGSGHGVGLCQTGALGMARAGKSAEAILEHYYRGIELKRLY